MLCLLSSVCVFAVLVYYALYAVCVCALRVSVCVCVCTCLLCLCIMKRIVCSVCVSVFAVFVYSAVCACCAGEADGLRLPGRTPARQRQARLHRWG